MCVVNYCLCSKLIGSSEFWVPFCWGGVGGGAGFVETGVRETASGGGSVGHTFEIVGGWGGCGGYGGLSIIILLISMGVVRLLGGVFGWWGRPFWLGVILSLIRRE